MIIWPTLITVYWNNCRRMKIFLNFWLLFTSLTFCRIRGAVNCLAPYLFIFIFKKSCSLLSYRRSLQMLVDDNNNIVACIKPKLLHIWVKYTQKKTYVVGTEDVYYDKKIRHKTSKVQFEENFLNLVTLHLLKWL